MFKRTGRQARLVLRRMQKNKNPFVFSYGVTPAQKWIARRKRKEKQFKFFGFMSIALSALFLGGLILNIVSNGYSAFTRVQLYIPIEFSQEILDPESTNDPAVLSKADYRKLVQNGLLTLFPANLPSRGKVRIIRAGQQGRVLSAPRNGHGRSVARRQKRGVVASRRQQC
jgi:hypothetical protein